MLLLAFICGCVSYQRDVYARPERLNESLFVNWFKNTWIFQVQQFFDIDRDIRVLAGSYGESREVDAEGNPPDSPLFTNRDIQSLTLDEVERDPNREPPPANPVTILKVKITGSPGFLGRDATRRLFLFKFDPPGYLELATGAEIVGSRLTFALGYNVPQTFLTVVEGTRNPRFKSGRAVASRIVPGEVFGFLRSSRFRHRREMRTLRLAYAFINNTDAKELNTLAEWFQNRPHYYLIDFGSSLGSDTTCPKVPRLGWENRWDAEVALANFSLLG